MSTTLFSIVIPCFNAEKWVVEAIDSVLSQGVRDTEVIVVDDGSTDGTPRVLESYGAAIRVIRQTNSGVVAARRVGVENAKGRFIKFLDADDVVPMGALEALRATVARSGSEVLIGRADVVGAASPGVGGQMYGIGYRPEHMAEVRKEFLLTQATHSSLWLIPRGLFHEHELFTRHAVQMGEEFDFCMRLIESGVGIKFVDLLVSRVRVHDSPGRLSRSRDEVRHLAQAAQIERAANFIRERIPDHSPAALEQIAKMCWSRGRACLRIGCAAASERYFDLARNIDPDVRPVGSTVYRVLCSVLGARKSEATLESLKPFLKFGGSR